MNTIAEYYLQTWGWYIRTNKTEYLGYPRRNVIHRMIHEGPGAGQSTAPVQYNPPEEVGIIDQAINSEKFPGAFRDVLFCCYVRKTGIRKGADSLGITREKYRGLVKQAEQRVQGYIDALEELTLA